MEAIKTALWYFVISIFLCFLPASTLYNGIKMAMRDENPFLVIFVLSTSFVTFFIVQTILQGIVFGEDKK